MGILKNQRIKELHDSVVSAQLVTSREVLLSGIDARLVANLPATGRSPGAQALSDLRVLNAAHVSEEGSTPLVVWLQNAIALSTGLPEAAVFECALRECEAARFAPSLVQPGGATTGEEPAHGRLPGHARVFVVRPRQYVGYSYALTNGDSLVAEVSSDAPVNVLIATLSTYRRWEKGERVRIDAFEEDHLRGQVGVVAQKNRDYVLWIENNDDTRTATVTIHAVALKRGSGDTSD